jgi:hypothetical protein
MTVESAFGPAPSLLGIIFAPCGLHDVKPRQDPNLSASLARPKQL